MDFVLWMEKMPYAFAENMTKVTTVKGNGKTIYVIYAFSELSSENNHVLFLKLKF